MTAIAARPSGRGRQPLEVEQQRDLREELRATRLEEHDFATRVLAVGTFLAEAPRAAHVTVNAGGELVYRASRRLRQLAAGSVVL